MKVGKGSRAPDSMQGLWEGMIWASMGLAAAAHIINSTHAVFTYSVTSGGDAAQKDMSDTANAVMSGATHATVLLAHLLAQIAVVKLYRGQVKPDNIKAEIDAHTHTAKIEMEKKGNISMTADGFVSIKSEKPTDIEGESIFLTAQKKIILHGRGGIEYKGGVKHKNFQILE